MFEITRRYELQAAHHLPETPKNHKCHRMHGHTYHVWVTITGSPRPSDGWFMDFYDVDLLWDQVHAQLDHQVLNDIEGLSNPTTENLCRWIWDVLTPELRAYCDKAKMARGNGTPRLAEIRVSENERSVVTYRNFQ